MKWILYPSTQCPVFMELLLGTKHSCWRKQLGIHCSAVRLKKKEKKQKNLIQFKPKPKYPTVNLWQGITVAEVSRRTSRNLSTVFEALSYLETAPLYDTPHSAIQDKGTLLELAKKLGYRVELRKPIMQENDHPKIEDLTRKPLPLPEELVKRPPVVTIMGHVDHGKTTLLDSLRHSSIVSQEHGGITQHIGAFTVNVPEGQITFLDTPGHAAFHAMRSRGAHATDIVILVVAADDGVMEQTVESIRFAREADVPIVVAINKIDKSQPNIQQIVQELLSFGVQLEEIGGDIQSVCISALKKQNLDKLLECILTLAEVMEISGDPKGNIEGIILETQVDSGKGKLSTALVQRGTLRKGDILVAGTSWAKVRAMYDDKGKLILEAPPSMPVLVAGWKSLPVSGDIILQAKSEKEAQFVVKYREAQLQKEKVLVDSTFIRHKREEHQQQYRQERNERLSRGRYRKDFSGLREKEMIWDVSPCLSVVLKGDVHGSIEAIQDVLKTYDLHDDCRLDLMNASVGNVTESDILLAEPFDGVVYCFNVTVLPSIKQLAEEKKVTIKVFNVIYHLIDDVKQELSLRLPLVRDENVLGEAMVLQEFLINVGKKKVPVAGCKCTKGIVKKGNCKIVRSEKVIYDGMLISLKHEKEDVEVIKKDSECGLCIEDSSVSFLPGDTIICFAENFVHQTTTWNPGF